MFGSGFLLGIILDIYRVLTVRFRIKGWVLSLIDLLYWLISAGLVFGLLFWSNWGEWRFYLFMAVLIGLFLYHQWLSRPVIRVLRVLFKEVERLLRLVIRLIYALICVPLLWLMRFVQSLLRGLVRFLQALGRVAMSPLLWLTRPLHQRFQAFVHPVIAKGRRLFRAIRKWWKQIRKKG